MDYTQKINQFCGFFNVLEEEMTENNYQAMSDKDLDETIGTYISQLKDALKEQSLRKQAKFDEVKEEYKTARDKLLEYSPFDRAQMAYYSPWTEKFKKTIWI